MDEQEVSLWRRRWVQVCQHDPQVTLPLSLHPHLLRQGVCHCESESLLQIYYFLEHVRAGVEALTGELCLQMVPNGQLACDAGCW
jgi:hypothetical protein